MLAEQSAQCRKQGARLHSVSHLHLRALRDGGAQATVQVGFTVALGIPIIIIWFYSEITNAVHDLPQMQPLFFVDETV